MVPTDDSSLDSALDDVVSDLCEEVGRKRTGNLAHLGASRDDAVNPE